jgi:hypothetical protein
MPSKLSEWFTKQSLIRQRLRRLEAIGRERPDLAPRPMGYQGWWKALRRPGVVLESLDEEVEVVEAICRES